MPDVPGGLRVTPIAVVHSPFTSQTDIPRQPAFAGPEAIGIVEVFESFTAGLDDIEGFERIWLISWLHLARPHRLRVVPHRQTGERGLFSTRSPSRPNPIGLSAVRLTRREGNLLHVADLDLLDGTPVLDIKPYSPHIDVFQAHDGWMNQRRVAEPDD